MEAKAEEAEEEAKEKAIAEPIRTHIMIGRTAVKTPEIKTTLIHLVEEGAMEEEDNPDAAMEDADGETTNIITTTKVITTSKTVKTTGTTTTPIQTSRVMEMEAVTTTNHITTRVLRELVGTTMQTNPTTGTDNQIIL